MHIVWTTVDRDLSTPTHITPLPTVQTVGAWAEPATHVSRWYNRAERSWVVAYATLSPKGRVVQVGASEYVYDLAEALDMARQMVEDAA